MRIHCTCPNCGYRTVIKYSMTIPVLLCFTIIGVIPWMIWFYNKKAKCPKCKCMLDTTHTIQTKDFGKVEEKKETKKKEA